MAIKRLQAVEEQEDDDEDVKGMKLLTNCRLVKNFPSVTLLHGEGERALTIRMYPSVRGTGWPQGTRLQHALPKIKPYSQWGAETLRALQKQADDGQSLWFADAKPLNIPESSAQHNRRRLKTVMADSNFMGRLWKIRFDPAVNHLIESTNQMPWNGEALLEVLLLIAHVHKPSFESIDLDVIKHIYLLEFKKSCTQYEHVGDFLLVLLRRIAVFLEERSCPNFLFANENLFECSPSEGAKAVAATFREILNDLELDSRNLVKWTGLVLPGNSHS